MLVTNFLFTLSAFVVNSVTALPTSSSSMSSVSQTQGPAPYWYHTIIVSDSCQNICSGYSISQDYFLSLNPQVVCSNLIVGSTVLVFSGFQTSQTTSYQYQIAVGDSCPSLCQTFAVSQASLMSLNPFLDCLNIQVGVTISITSTYQRTYQISHQDTYESVCNTFGLTAYQFSVLNSGSAFQAGSSCNVGGSQYRYTSVQSYSSCSEVCSSFSITPQYLIDMNENLSCEYFSSYTSVYNTLIVSQCHGGYHAPTTTMIAAPTSSVVASSSVLSSSAVYAAPSVVLPPPGNAPAPSAPVVVVVVATSYVSPTPVCDTQHFYHTVQTGETCDHICSKYSISTDYLTSLNYNMDCGSLTTGTQVSVFYGSYVQQNTTCSYPSYTGRYYTPTQPETCDSMCSKFNIEHSDLYSYNSGLDCNNITTGTSYVVGGSNQVIYTPSTETETCHSIASTYYCSAESIPSYNSGLDCKNIQTGTPIVVGHAAPIYYYSTSTSSYSTYAVKTTSYVASTYVPAPSTAPSCQQHIVVNGDTCYNLWTAYGISQATFYSMNPYINCYNLQIGSSICVGTDNYVPIPTCQSPHTVVQGDICYNLWISSGISSDLFYRLNPGIDCYNLKIGSTLCLASATPNHCYREHSIIAGDICYNLWNMYNLSSSQFLGLNSGIDCSNLQIGSKVCVGNSTYYQAPPTSGSACPASAYDSSSSNDSNSGVNVPIAVFVAGLLALVALVAAVVYLLIQARNLKKIRIQREISSKFAPYQPVWEAQVTGDREPLA